MSNCKSNRKVARNNKIDPEHAEKLSTRMKSGVVVFLFLAGLAGFDVLTSGSDEATTSGKSGLMSAIPVTGFVAYDKTGLDCTTDGECGTCGFCADSLDNDASRDCKQCPRGTANYWSLDENGLRGSENSDQSFDRNCETKTTFCAASAEIMISGHTEKLVLGYPDNLLENIFVNVANRGVKDSVPFKLRWDYIVYGETEDSTIDELLKVQTVSVSAGQTKKFTYEAKYKGKVGALLGRSEGRKGKIIVRIDPESTLKEFIKTNNVVQIDAEIDFESEITAAEAGDTNAPTISPSQASVLRKQREEQERHKLERIEHSFDPQPGIANYVAVTDTIAQSGLQGRLYNSEAFKKGDYNTLAKCTITKAYLWQSSAQGDKRWVDISPTRPFGNVLKPKIGSVIYFDIDKEGCTLSYGQVNKLGSDANIVYGLNIATKPFNFIGISTQMLDNKKDKNFRDLIKPGDCRLPVEMWIWDKETYDWKHYNKKELERKKFNKKDIGRVVAFKSSRICTLEKQKGIF